MKRCIVCGNECDDACRFCEICGNPFGGDDDGLTGRAGVSVRAAQNAEEAYTADTGERDIPESVNVAEDFETLPEEALEDKVSADGDEAKMPSGSGQGQGDEPPVLGFTLDQEVKEAIDDLASGRQRENTSSYSAAEESVKQDSFGAEAEESREQSSFTSLEGESISQPSAEDSMSQSSFGLPTDESVRQSSFGSLPEESGEQSSIGSLAEEHTSPSADGAAAEQKEVPSGTRQERRSGRMKSGPHIYGQEDNPASVYQGPQGVIRKEVKGGKAAAGHSAVTPAGDGSDPDSANSAAGRTGSAQGRARIRTGVRDEGETPGAQTRNTKRGNHAAVRGSYPAGPSAEGTGSTEGAGRASQSDSAENRRPPRTNGTAEQEAGRRAAADSIYDSGSGTREPARNIPSDGRNPVSGAPMDGYSQERPARRPSQGHSSAARIVSAARELLCSPLFLLIVLLQTVYTAGSVAAIFLRQLNYSQIARLLSESEIPSQLKGYAGSAETVLLKLDSGAQMFNLAIRIPDILFCLGLWLVWMLAHRKKERMSGAGFVLMKIVILINMIVSCAVLLLVLILSVTLVIATWGAGTRSMVTAAVVVLVGAIIVTMAVVMYYFCYLSTIQVCRVNAVSGEQCGKASGYVAVIHIFMALTSVITILSGIVNLEIANIAAGIGGLGWKFLFGIWIFWYRSHMRKCQ